MQYALTAEQAKTLDRKTSEVTLIPSLILMEHAAIALAQEIKKKITGNEKVLFVCGSGNNGADGVAAARLLFKEGIHAEILMAGKLEHATKEMKLELAIAENIGLVIRSVCTFSEYNIIVDSIMGIGLNKPVTGDYEKIIQEINRLDKTHTVISCDIPTGISADTGEVLGIAVKAQKTVCFGTLKRGVILYPGALYAGEVVAADIGLDFKFLPEKRELSCVLEKADIEKLLPKRRANSNKGTYGKALIFAGSDTMSGAAYLSSMAAYRMGTGLVKIVTAKKIIPVLMELLPEAVFSTYEQSGAEEVQKMVNTADAVLFGPGISVSEESLKLMDLVVSAVKKEKKQLILDADGLNLLSKKMNELHIEETGRRISYIEEYLPKDSILTPHLLELSRLILCPVDKIHSNLIDIGGFCTYNRELIYVIKDARTVIVSKNQLYVNCSGNDGMSTGGSGDVLSGILTGLLVQRKMYADTQTKEETAALGVFVHGLAGDLAQQQLGAHSMLARDIINALPEAMKDYERDEIQRRVLTC